ncbi:MAG TPA: hypothetical protein VLU25_07015 [Acidobacteriota bacterium]|nr:hypothetical protein [Acidobacteriota bacterium]
MNRRNNRPLGLLDQAKLILGFFRSPSAALKKLSLRAPMAVALLSVTVLGVVLQWALLPYLEQAALGSLRHQPGSAELEQTLRLMSRVQMLALLFYPILMIVKWALLGLMLALSCQLAGVATTLRQSFSIIAHASFLPLLQTAQVLLILMLKGVGSVRRPSDLQPPLGLDLLWAPQDELALLILHNLNPFEIAYLCFITAAVAMTDPHASRLRALAACAPLWLLTLTSRVLLSWSGRPEG